MSLFLRQIARHAVKRLASDPRAQEKAAKAARAVVDRANEIANEKDRARAAGRALRRIIKEAQGDR